MINVENIRNENIKFLKNQNIEIVNLPFLDLPNNIRDKKEIINRINVLHILYTIYLEGSKSKLFFYDLIKQNGWELYLSDKEKRSLLLKSIDKQTIIDFSWKKESMFPLLWSIYVTSDTIICDFRKEIDLSNYYSQIPPEINLDTCINNAVVRPIDEILRMADLYYLLHYFSKHNNVTNSISSIIIERRYALEWLINPHVCWDNLTLDT